MKTKLIPTAIMLALTMGAYAYDVRFHAVGAQGEDECYATCRIYALPDTIKPCAVGIADSLGCYKANLDSAGSYRLSVQGAGSSTINISDFKLSDAEPSLNLGDIVLGGVEQLNEVVVTAQRPLVVKQIDRIGYNVQADPEVLTLSTRDILRNVPMVAVDGEGNITINGSSNFKVFKNGRPNNSMTKNAKDILNAIPASMIKSIEVITEPGAKYDAEGIGAILNIVTIDNAVIDGVLGNVTGGYDPYTKTWDVNPYITTQIRKVTFSLQAGVKKMSEKATHNDIETETKYNSGIKDKNTQSTANRGCIGWLSGDGSWELNKKNLFTMELGGFYYNVKPRGALSNQRFDATGLGISSYSSIIDYPKYAYLDFDGNLNYQLTTDRAGETFTASYAVSTTDQNIKQYLEYNDVVGDLFNYSSTIGKSNLNFIEHTFQADWIRPFSTIHTLEVGGKYILRSNTSTNNTEYAGWTTIDDEFKHITDVGALYAQYTARLNKVSLRAGLRYEYSKLKADYPKENAEGFSSEFNDLVPSAAVSWNINDANSLSFNYASRINRPGISYLNPIVEYLPTNISYGNPNLESVYSNSLKVSYMYIKPKINFNISADYSFNNDNIAQVQFADANGIITSTYDNVGHERNLSLSAFMQWTITPKTRMMFNGNVNYNKLKQEGLALDRWKAMLWTRITQDLPWKLRLGVNASYFSGGLIDVYSYSKVVSPIPVYYTLSLSRSFLKKDCLTVTLLANNFIGNHSIVNKQYTVQGDYSSLTRVEVNSKSFQLTVSYRFGSLNAAVKKTATSINNDDLVGQKK